MTILISSQGPCPASSVPDHAVLLGVWRVYRQRDIQTTKESGWTKGQRKDSYLVIVWLSERTQMKAFADIRTSSAGANAGLPGMSFQVW